MSRFVDETPGMLRSTIYRLVTLVVIEIVASLLAAILFTAVIVHDLGGVDEFIADPVGVMLPMIVGFQTFILEAEAIRYAIEPYVDLRSGLIVLGVSTTLYVVSAVLVVYTLRRVGFSSSRDVDEYLRGRHA